MRNFNQSAPRKYMRVCKESGCISAEYRIDDDDVNESMIVPYENNETSGKFIIKKHSGRK